MKNGWQTVQLDDVLQRVKTELTIDDTATYKQVTVRLWNKGVVLRGEQDGIAIKTKRQFFVKTGQLLMSCIDVRNGAIGLVPKELDGAIVSNDFWVYDFNEDRLLPKFLAHYVATPKFAEDANRTSSGTTNRIRAAETTFLKIEIPLPPLDEQRRIVERVEAIAPRIAKAQSLREEAKIEVDAILAASMNNVFDFSRANTRLGDYITVISGYGFPSGDYVESGTHQILRIGNVRDGYLNLSRSPIYWNFDGDKRIRKVELQEGDIVISMTGTRNKRDYGYVAIVPAKSKLLLNQRLGKIIPKTDIDTKYLYYFLRSPFFKDRLFPQAKGTANQANISNNHIEGIQFGNLPPLDEQRRIVTYLDSVQARLASLRELQSATGEELGALLPSVLDRAFRGLL